MTVSWDAPPFVGRQRPLKELRRHVSRGTSVLLIGGRRFGKTYLLDQLGDVQRTVFPADVGGWDRRSEDSVRAELAALLGVPGSTRAELEAALTARVPLAIILDEADLLLGEPWSKSFLQWLRYLDGTRLRNGIAIVLVGGPVLDGWTDADDRGSPPLNLAERVYLDPLDDAAIAALVAHLPTPPPAELLRVVGGHPWLLVKLCEMLADEDGEVDPDAMIQRLDDRCSHSFALWQRQVGPGGVRLLQRLRGQPIAANKFVQEPEFARIRGDLLRCRYVGLVRQVSNAWEIGPTLALGSLLAAAASRYDLAISYSREDRDLACTIKNGLPESRVFFDLDEQTWLWGQSYDKVFPGIYEIEARFVLVLATPDYRRKHWTRVEFDAAMRGREGRILVVDLGGLPEDMPPELLFLPGTPDVLVKLVPTLQAKLSG